jgi:HlyD family secretion protein
MSGKLKWIMKKKLTKAIAILLVLAVAFSALVKFDVIKLGSKKAIVQQQRTSRVRKGDISISVTGSGSIVSSNRIDITPKVSGIITKVCFKEGDTVKKGDLLFELDDSDAKLNLEEIKANIKKAELSSSNSVKSVNNLNITAPFNGKITKIDPKVGDTLGKNAGILTITDMSKLKVVLPFSGSAIKEISSGKEATVYIQDLMQSIKGTVTYVSGSSNATSTGGEVYNVEITINNPGSLKEGMKASAEISTSKGEAASNDTGSIEYINTETIKSDAGGTVKSINVRENDMVEAGKIAGSN